MQRQALGLSCRSHSFSGSPCHAPHTRSIYPVHWVDIHYRLNHYRHGCQLVVRCAQRKLQLSSVETTASDEADNETNVQLSSSISSEVPAVDNAVSTLPPATGMQRPQKTELEGAPTGVLPQDAFHGVFSTALLISPFFFWGTSMVAMKEVLPHATPLLISTLRLLPAGVALVAWAAADGRQQPQTPLAWAWVAAFAVVDAAAFQGCLAEGLQRTSAGLGSVIIDSQPLSVAVMAALLFGERLSPAGILGLFLGVAGLLLLELEPLESAAMLDSLSTTPLWPQVSHLLAAGSGAAGDGATAAAGGGGWQLWDSGEWWMLLAAQSMAVGTVMVRGVAQHCDPFVATGWHMILGGLMLLAAIVATDPASIPASLSQFQPQDYLAMAYVSLLGGAASYGVFFDNATRGNLTALSSLTFLTPMFAAGAGFLLLHETLTPLQLTGAGITLSAVYLINK